MSCIPYFNVIVFTSPTEVEDEHKKIEDLFAAGVDWVHIRKPEYSLESVDKLIDNIDYKLHPRLRLHDHFSLLEKFDLGGVQLNHRNPSYPEKCKSVSLSAHSVEEIINNKESTLEYVTLSPIFDSISKTDYKSKFDIDNLNLQVVGLPVIALGGVTPDEFPILKAKGFSGAGLLGYIWSGSFNLRLSSLRRAIRCIE